MPVPKVLTFEVPRRKRAKSEESFAGRSANNNNTNTNWMLTLDYEDEQTTASMTTFRTMSAHKNTLCWIIAFIFAVGFLLGQIVPSMKNNYVTSLTTQQPAWHNTTMSTSSTISTKTSTNKNLSALATMTTIRDDDKDAGDASIDNISTPTTVTTTNDTASSDASYFLHALQTQDLSLSRKIQLLPQFRVAGEYNNDVLSLYSKTAQQRLQKLLKSSNHEYNVVINGGSSSAGGGNLDRRHRFYSRFVDKLKQTHHIPHDKFNIIDRAHGSRNSLHSAWLGDSFFPTNSKPDLILWEFSINDQLDGDAVDVRNELILWFRKIKAIYSDPPLVIIVYLWNKNFGTNLDGNLKSDVYRHHRHLGAEFDFCLGHVNLAAYLDELQFSGQDLEWHFLADSHHPNALSHAALAMLLTTLVQSPQLKELPTDATPAQTDIEWTCADDMESQWEILEVFTAGAESKASFTAEQPVNMVLTSNRNMMTPILQYNNSNNGELVKDTRYQHFQTNRYGLAKAGRVDRHRAVVLPFCQDGAMLVFEIEQRHLPIMAIQYMLHGGFKEEFANGGELGGRRRRRRTKVFGVEEEDAYDHVQVTINHKDYGPSTISAENWECILKDPLFSHWILPNKKDGKATTEISFCSKDRQMHLALEHFILF